MMVIDKLTTVGRTIDLRYATNRAIAIVTGVLFVGGTVFQLYAATGWFQSIVWGVNAGLTVFLTWALCRELDPDHAMSAFVAVGLALLGLLCWGLPLLSVAFWLILVARVVNRSTGMPAGILDALAVAGLGIWLSLDGNWAYGAISVLALFLTSQLPEGAGRRLTEGAGRRLTEGAGRRLTEGAGRRLTEGAGEGQLVLAGLAAAATAAAAAVAPRPAEGVTLTASGALIGLAASILFLPVILSARHVESLGDRSGAPLWPRRVQAAQVLALGAGLAAALVGGIDAVGALAPLWAAILGASAHWLYRWAKS